MAAKVVEVGSPLGRWLRLNWAILTFCFTVLLAVTSGWLTVEARLESRDADPRVRVIVRDTGKGIPKEDLDRIMEPFFTQKQGGTGLGLSVVSRLLQLHGSQLEVHSEVGVGTSMEFLLSAFDGKRRT